MSDLDDAWVFDDEDEEWEEWDDEEWEEDDLEDWGHFRGPPMPDEDDQQLGPVVDLFCQECRRHTEHLVIEEREDTGVYRCSQCYAQQLAELQPVLFDPTWEEEQEEGGDLGPDDLPF